jgi:hypothetical protein
MTLRPLFNLILDLDVSLVCPSWPPVSSERGPLIEGAAFYERRIVRVGPIQIAHKKFLYAEVPGPLSFRWADGFVPPPN